MTLEVREGHPLYKIIDSFFNLYKKLKGIDCVAGRHCACYPKGFRCCYCGLCNKSDNVLGYLPTSLEPLEFHREYLYNLIKEMPEDEPKLQVTNLLAWLNLIYINKDYLDLDSSRFRYFKVRKYGNESNNGNSGSQQ